MAVQEIRRIDYVFKAPGKKMAKVKRPSVCCSRLIAKQQRYKEARKAKNCDARCEEPSFSYAFVCALSAPRRWRAVGW